MKRIFLILAAAALFAGCCSSGQKYDISGTWEDGEGMTVSLKKMADKNVFETVDSAVVSQGRFSMKGEVPHIDKYVVKIGDDNEEVLLDGVPIVFTVTTEHHENKRGEIVASNNISVAGSPEQDILRRVNSLAMTKGFLGLGSMLMMMEAGDDPQRLDSLSRMLEAARDEIEVDIGRYFDSINDSYAITYGIGDFIAREYPFEYAERYYGNLTERIRQSYPGQLLGEKIDRMRDVNVGGVAPEIELPAPDGTLVSLSSLRGKYVLVDFWASWCGPCLAEAPNVKAIYEDYRDRGFEIYGISLDDKDKRDAWLEKIDEYDMDWVHVSSLSGWECPAAQRYNVTAIPRMFLLDPQGRIIGVDLRGEALREKVASLFE